MVVNFLREKRIFRGTEQKTEPHGPGVKEGNCTESESETKLRVV